MRKSNRFCHGARSENEIRHCRYPSVRRVRLTAIVWKRRKKNKRENSSFNSRGSHLQPRSRTRWPLCCSRGHRTHCHCVRLCEISCPHQSSHYWKHDSIYIFILPLIRSVCETNKVIWQKQPIKKRKKDEETKERRALMYLGLREKNTLLLSRSRGANHCRTEFVVVRKALSGTHTSRNYTTERNTINKCEVRTCNLLCVHSNCTIRMHT